MPALTRRSSRTGQARTLNPAKGPDTGLCPGFDTGFDTGFEKTPRTNAVTGAVRLLTAVLWMFTLAQPASAQLIDKRVEALTALDRQYMNTQRELASELTLRHYGRRCCRSTDELMLLQRLLDDGFVRADQTRELQAMGVAMGDLLARELGLQWVVYEDINGRSRALQMPATDNYLFPVTMISRRREANDATTVMEIYQKSYAAIDALRPPRPFE